MKYNILFITLVFIGFSSCVSHKELISFNEINLPEDSSEQILNNMNIRIQPEDLLRITVHSLDPLAVAPFNLEDQTSNQQISSNQGTQQLELFSGYVVDQDGFIDFPVLGQIAVKGLTLEEVKRDILVLLQNYLRDPVVNIRYLNFKITMLGEVNLPGTIHLTNKRVTLLEALGMAEGLTHYANRTNVLIIREKDDVRTYQRLNLQGNEIFTSPYFYLQQNDVIYVEPLKARVATVADPAQRIISYSTAALSLITLVIALSR